MKKNPTVGIIGDKGSFGTRLKEFCLANGFRVIGSDLHTPLSNEDVVKKSDVVIFSVLPHVAVKVIEEALPFSRPDQLWLDVTSVKVIPIELMRKSKAEVVGLHPMAAPSVDSFEGQVIFRCVERLGRWRGWLDAFLALTKAKIVDYQPHTHDIYVAPGQPVLHSTLIAMMGMVGILRIQQLDPRMFLEQATPLCYWYLVLGARVLSRDPQLYADIQLFNPYALSALRIFQSTIAKLIDMIEKNDKEGFIAEFTQVKSYFKEESLHELSELFEKVVKDVAQERAK
ncbi:MAG: prephenate dehydrogenase [Patescibacteria group bacterium]|nr:prephenate dehydrogenase [bacterium]MDZ4240988.1 prephenate dehydrogenase [Patescibacteria group bacterium]